jgi:hypothetical protein
MKGQKSEYWQLGWWLTISSDISIKQTRIVMNARLISEGILGKFSADISG